MGTAPPARRKHERLDFVSLGLVILDELHFPHRETLHDVPGGSGSFGTFGARIVAPAARSKAVACIILTGDDFPDTVLEQFQSWDLSLVIRHIPGAKSTRGLLEYKDRAFGRKTFQYLTPTLQATPEHLEAARLLHAASFHFLARSEDLDTMITDLLTRRVQERITDRPLLVWEPAPPHCNVDTLNAHLQACRRVDVFSPNHLELISFFEDKEQADQPLFARDQIEKYAQRFLDANSNGISPPVPEAISDETSPLAHQLEDNLTVDTKKRLKIVIRAGEHGCLIMSNVDEPAWLPAFYDAASPKIVDATGAGNAFLGALTIRLRESNSLRESAIYGSVAASFALEQIGLPTRDERNGREVWNGVDFALRLTQYRERFGL